jgi:hypothetical protein
MTRWARRAFVALGLTSIAMLAGCNGGNSGFNNSFNLFNGPTRPMGNGQAQSFVRLNAAGQPIEVGLTFNAAALNNLPTAPDTSFLLPLPTQGVATPFDHISLDWESQGHDPVPIFGTPHFDVHFYLINQAERDTIAFAPDQPAPAAQFIPPDYVSGHTVVPRMGQHWTDSTDPNTTPGQFNHTLIYGFHNGKMVFLEPMITRDFLLTKTNFAGAIKQPVAFPKPGFYPTHYSIKFNATTNTYTITLDQFVQRP